MVAQSSSSSSSSLLLSLAEGEEEGLAVAGEAGVEVVFFERPEVLPM